jgi:KEOPS complex subunit Cgi121
MSTEKKIPGDSNNRGERKIHQVRFHVLDLQLFLQDLRKLAQETRCAIICFNHDMMAGRKHVEGAIRFAERSFRSENPISRSIEVEALLYAAGTRQTGLIGPFGIKAGLNECYLSLIPYHDEVIWQLERRMGFVDNESWEEMSVEKSKKLQNIYGITPVELEIVGTDKLSDLILERVALLTINR